MKCKYSPRWVMLTRFPIYLRSLLVRFPKPSKTLNLPNLSPRCRKCTFEPRTLKSFFNPPPRCKSGALHCSKVHNAKGDITHWEASLSCLRCFGLESGKWDRSYGIAFSRFRMPISASCRLGVLRLMDKILHDPKDPKLWELWYIPYNG